MQRTVPMLAGALAFLTAAACYAQSGQAPTEPQIAAIVVTANQVDIDAGYKPATSIICAASIPR